MNVCLLFTLEERQRCQRVCRVGVVVVSSSSCRRRRRHPRRELTRSSVHLLRILFFTHLVVVLRFVLVGRGWERWLMSVLVALCRKGFIGRSRTCAGRLSARRQVCRPRGKRRGRSWFGAATGGPALAKLRTVEPCDSSRCEVTSGRASSCTRAVGTICGSRRGCDRLRTVRRTRV